MTVLSGALLVLFVLLGLAAVPLGLPGTFVILAAALLYGWATGFASVTWGTVGILLAAALLAEGIEALASVFGAKRYGSGNAGVAAALAGGIAGAILGAPFFLGAGAIPGALAGAFAAAVLAERLRGRPWDESLRAGWGTFLGRVAGTAAKGVIALAMAVLTIRRAFW